MNELALCSPGPKVVPMKRLLSLGVIALGFCVGCNKGDKPAAATAATPATATPAPSPSGLVAEGSIAPPIDVTAHTGEHVTLAAFKGKPVVLYFYPKDDTPGCTREASEIRDAWEKLKQTDAVVLGVSTQDNESHVAFANKYQLPFLLLPDKDGVIAGAYGVPLRLGIAKRVTFIIDRQGKIAKVFPEVNPSGHAAEILTVLTSLHS
jgi:peroxiredoxin Q/BCP